MNELTMEIRNVDPDLREMVGRVVPYDEVSYLTADPSGERILRGAFTKSIRQRGGRIPLLRNHDQSRKIGNSTKFTDDPEGLIGHFKIVTGDHGDLMLEDLRNGCLDMLSVGFKPINVQRGADGVREVREAMLGEVSVCAVPAYQGAAVLAVRNAQDLDVLLAPFQNRPVVNLEPVPPLLYSPRR
jgi:hypothetical protein